MLVVKTKEEFDNIISQIRFNVERYERYLKEVQYKLYLANKKAIDISYQKDSIPHLLGIDLDFLRGLNCYREKSAYELMTAFLDDSYRAYVKLDDLGRVFSDYVFEKNEIFRENLKIVLTDIDCVVEYKKERVYGLETPELPCEYYILQKRSDLPSDIILLIGLIKRDNSFVIQTNQKLDLTIPKDQESLRLILFQQNITFVNALRYSNSYDTDPKNFYLDLQSKNDKLLVLNRYSNQYNSTIVVDGDYGYLLKRLTESYMNQTKMKTTLQTVSSMIATGDVIDIDALEDEVDCDIKDVVKTYNNSLFKEKSEFKYSELLEEYNKLKVLVEDMQRENASLQEWKATKEVMIEQLQSENESHKKTEQKIFSLLQNVNGGGI